ncbi:Uncharacterised protein [Mycobacteroides abscessus subsp. bolletii]|nr:Uncharacterised protein [Mycobacteroides abscessus subsp. bolletii]
MMVSVLVAVSSPARSMDSSSWESGLPCASLRLSTPTIRMSIAPSSGLPALPNKPGRSNRAMFGSMLPIFPQAAPVITMTATAASVAIPRHSGRGGSACDEPLARRACGSVTMSVHFLSGRAFARQQS